MLTVGLVVVICLTISWWITRRSSQYDRNALLIGGLVGVLIGFSIATLLGSMVSSREWKVVSTSELQNIRSVDGLQGNFFVGIGSIGPAYSYSYYEKTGENGYIPRTLTLNDQIQVVILEEDRSNGVLISKGSTRKPADGLTWQRDWVIIDDYYVRSPNYFEFHVPKGTVSRSFVLQ